MGQAVYGPCLGGLGHSARTVGERSKGCYFKNTLSGGTQFRLYRLYFKQEVM